MYHALAYDVCKQCIAEHGTLTRDVQVTIDKMLLKVLEDDALVGIPLYWRFFKTFVLSSSLDRNAQFERLTGILQHVPAEVAYVLGEVYLEKCKDSMCTHLFAKALNMFEIAFNATHDPLVMCHKASSLTSLYMHVGAAALNRVFASSNGSKQVLKLIMEAYQFYMRDAYSAQLFAASAPVDYVFLNKFPVDLFTIAMQENKQVNGENHAILFTSQHTTNAALSIS